MTAAEIRAVWQRAVNRCFVQEDAKRAPKLACCQQPSSASKLANEGKTRAAECPYCPATGSMPLNRNPSYVNVLPDAKCSLLLQPNFGYRKGLTPDQLNSLEAEEKSMVSRDGRHFTHCDGNRNSFSLLSEDCNLTADCVKECRDLGTRKVEGVYSESIEELMHIDTRTNQKQLDMNPIRDLKSRECKDCQFGQQCSWIEESEKNKPWWQVTGKDDLASFVARKSFDRIENCDLPPPRKIKRYSCIRPDTSGIDYITPASLNGKLQCEYACCQSIHTPSSERTSGCHSDISDRHSLSSSRNSLSYATFLKGYREIDQASKNDSCKAQLLEALSHSQTRAREAEKAAKQAYDEKDDIVKLLFRQASELFAYKQWFHLLQLETLYYQMKTIEKQPPMPSLIPIVLPWTMPNKSRKLHRDLRAKRGHSMDGVCKFAVLALGLSLVGAGLLLGWTVAWMLPL